MLCYGCYGIGRISIVGLGMDFVWKMFSFLGFMSSKILFFSFWFVGVVVFWVLGYEDSKFDL